MNNHEIKEYAESFGAHVVIKSFDTDDSNKTVCINVGLIKHLEIEGTMRCWKHAIFIDREEVGWKIGYSQYGVTRSLNDEELRFLIKIWIQDPSNDHFIKYEKT